MNKFRNTISSHAYRSILGCLIVYATTLSASEEQGVYLIPSLGYLQFDKDRSLKSKILPGVGVGFSTQSPWAVELHYHAMDTNTSTNQKVEFNYTRLDALYRFGNPSGWQPYLAGGIGHAKTNYATSRDSSETLFNLGGGLIYHFTENFNARTDLRVLQSEDGFTDGLASVGLSLIYLFNTSKPVVEPVSKPIQVKKAIKAVTKVIDTDGDGVPDTRDACPNTKKKAKVGSDGCYVLLEEKKTFSLNVIFANNSDTINQQHTADIEALSKFLQLYPKTSVTIEGHSDSLGDENYNKSLSQRRSESVRKVLIEKFSIQEDRITAIGFGEENPIASNETSEGRKKNRRVNAIVETTVKQLITE